MAKPIGTRLGNFLNLRYHDGDEVGESVSDMKLYPEAKLLVIVAYSYDDRDGGYLTTYSLTDSEIEWLKGFAYIPGEPDPETHPPLRLQPVWRTLWADGRYLSEDEHDELRDLYEEKLVAEGKDPMLRASWEDFDDGNFLPMVFMPS